ncbi:sperm-associated antigen 8 [Candoia aspera]|uniref:sperm-associated antigen 8 n=1 Tax=Candoia aspera TaxID=51853 RepID=UPI002FD871C0
MLFPSLPCARPQPPSHGEAGAAAAAAAAPASAEEPRLCPTETAPCVAEMLPGPEAGLQAAATHAVELPPCHGLLGPYLGELPAADLQPLPPSPPEPPRELPPRGQCLMHNWQEERATNDLDRVPRPEYGTEGFFYRHGHPGLLTLEFLAGVAKSTTMKDSYLWPLKTGLPMRGKREAMMEHLLYQKHSKSLLEDDVYPPPQPLESTSITHRDYNQEGVLSMPPLPTQVRAPLCWKNGQAVHRLPHWTPPEGSWLPWDFSSPLCSPTTIGWSNHRPSGSNMPKRCR